MDTFEIVAVKIVSIDIFLFVDLHFFHSVLLSGILFGIRIR